MKKINLIIQFIIFAVLLFGIFYLFLGETSFNVLQAMDSFSDPQHPINSIFLSIIKYTHNHGGKGWFSLYPLFLILAGFSLLRFRENEKFILGFNLLNVILLILGIVIYISPFLPNIKYVQDLH